MISISKILLKFNNLNWLLRLLFVIFGLLHAKVQLGFV